MHWHSLPWLVFVVVISPLAASARPPGLTLPESVVNATLTTEIDASEGAFGDIVSLAPDLALGATDDLTLLLVHSTVGRTGFRGNAGGGVCVTEACAEAYDNVGFEALYGVSRNPFAAALDLGVHAFSLDRGWYVAKLGGKLRGVSGPLTIASAPSVTLAMTDRDDEPSNRDRLWLPVTFAFAFSPELAAGIGTGIKGPLDNFGDEFELALGAFATVAPTPTASLGISWVHGKIVAGDSVMNDGIESRAIHIWASVTR